MCLSLTLEASAKRVNPSNPAFCTPFTTLFSSEQHLGPNIRLPITSLPGSPHSSHETPAPAQGIGNLPWESYIVVVKGADAIASYVLKNGCILTKAGGRCHDTDSESDFGPYGGRPPRR